LRDLWKFAFDCVYEEEAMRRINNWSWAHMREHVAQCKKYRELYKVKLTSTKISDEVTKKLRKLEERLDEVNIRIQRQLAEREVEIQVKVAAETASTGVWGWLTGASKKASTENASNAGNNIKKFEEALSPSEKEKLYEVSKYRCKRLGTTDAEESKAEFGRMV
jgi:vacuolar protein sorting-associated protein 13A/C